MNSKRLFFILLAAILLLFGGLFASAYYANSYLQKSSEQIVEKRAQVSQLERQQQSLVKAKKEVATYRELSEIAKSVVPQDKDQAQTVREIVNIAASNGIRLGSVTFPSSTLGTAKPGSKSKTTTNSNLSQLTPVPDMKGVYNLQIIVTSDSQTPVTYNRFVSFLDDLEHNRRTALVNNINITPSKENPGTLTFTLTLDEYIKP